MRTTQQLSITLPTKMADDIKRKVQAGEYASESEVIREGLRSLMARDKAIEHWLIQHVIPAYDELKINPSKAVTGEQIRSRLFRKLTK